MIESISHSKHLSQMKKIIDRSPTLGDFTDTFKLLNTAIANIRFMTKFSVKPNYCLDSHPVHLKSIPVYYGSFCQDEQEKR